MIAIGAILVFWAGIWMLWDHRAVAPGLLLMAGGICLLTGSIGATP